MAYVNDVAALTPKNWADTIQENIRKEFTVMDVADLRFKKNLSFGDTVHFPIFGALTATAYVKGTDVTVQALDSTDEYLTINQQWESSFYLDLIDKKQNLYSTMQEGINELTNALKEKVETLFYAEVLNAHDTFDNGDIGEGSPGDAIGLTTTNVIKVFSKARAKLKSKLKGRVAVAVVTYDVASIIEQKAAASGFNVADAAFKNGYAGNFLGWRIYVSEFLDDSSNRYHCYIGASKAISLAMQIPITMQIDTDPLKFGKVVKGLEVFDKKTFTRNGERFLDLQIGSAV